MKRTKALIMILVAAFSFTAAESCKNKKKADTTQGTTTSDAPVVVSTDSELKTSVNTVVKEYEGVQADVNDGVIVLRGTVKQVDLQKLIQRINELKPKKIDNQLVIKVN